MFKKNFTNIWNNKNILAYKRLKHLTTTKINFCTNNTNNTKAEDDNRYNPEHRDKLSKKLKIMELFPERAQLYLKLGRYDRPVGYLLLFFPCAAGLTLGAPHISLLYFKYLSLFFGGSVLMRSAGCIINDMWDKDIDKQVIRSSDRPLASEKITYTQASVFLAGHLLASLGILFQLPTSSIIAGFSIMPIVIIYPYMKRITHFPQIFLGLAFNSGIIVGYPAMTGLIDFSLVLPFYLGGILWTMVYDTIYAHMDKSDDEKINVKSTALYFRDHSKTALYIFTILMMGLYYYTLNKQRKNKTKSVYLSDILLLSGLIFQFNSIYKVNLNSPASCLKHFKANSYFGFIILLACIANLQEKNK